MKKTSWAWIIGGVALLLGVGVWWMNGFGGRDSVAAIPTFSAAHGPLTISVTESGTIQSRERVNVRSEVEGQTTILWVIPEGTHVEEGDLLIELDASQLDERKADMQIRVINAEAAFVRAREQLAIIENQTQADISRAELDYRFAQLNRTKYSEGEYPQQLQRAEADINLAQEELQRANDKLEWSRRLAGEGYLTRMELQADELAARRATIDLTLAEGKLHLLQEYTHQQQLEELESEVDQKRLALERTRLRASADVVQAKADYQAKKSEFERQEDRLQNILDQIEKCRIVAPAAGMVVYATTGQGRRGMTEEPLREGQPVRERQDLIYLPTAAAMMAEIRIHESSLRKVREGMRARIRVDAVPDRIFEGVVHRIALLPDAQSGWLNPDLKVYQTDVHLIGEARALRPGMSCRAEIIIEELDDAIYVPLQTVVRVGDESVVFVPGPNGPQPRPVEPGLDNNRMIHIVSGLNAGEPVLLTPPLQMSRRPEGPPREREPDVAPPRTPGAPDAERRSGTPREGGGRPAGAPRSRPEPAN